MFNRMVLFLFLLGGCGTGIAFSDSSKSIFDDTKIHDYQLKIYYPDWEDSLKYYKNMPDEIYIPARFLYRISPHDSITFDSVGVRYKGNSSYDFAAKSRKKPFKIKFDEYRDGQNFFGVKRLNFSNGAKDPTMMREKISYDIIGKFMPAPRAAFATITIDNELIGLYTQVEQVDKIFLARHFSDNDFNLFKSGDNGSTLQYVGHNQASYEPDYELKTNEKLNDWSAFVNMIYQLSDTSRGNSMHQVGNRLNLDNICRYLAFNIVVSNFDSYTGSGRNYYLYDDSVSGKFTIIPWDMNLSFGAYTNNWNVITMDAVAVSNLAQRPLNRRIIENDSLRHVYLRYIQAMIDGPVCTDSIAAMTARFRLLIDSSVQADSNKLHSYENFIMNLDSNVSVTDGIARTTIPGLKLFSLKRIASLRSQLVQNLSIGNPLRRSSLHTTRLECRTGNAGRSVTVNYATTTTEPLVRFDLFDVFGRLLRSFETQAECAGMHTFTYSTGSLCNGWYLLKMTTSSGALAIGTQINGRL